MARRANGEGSIFKLGDGRWRVVLSAGTIGGKRRRISCNTRSRADAVARLAELRAKLNHAGFREPSTMTIDRYLVEWLDVHVKAYRSPATEALYRTIVVRYISPKIGSVLLRKLRTVDVQSMVDRLVNDSSPGRCRQLALTILRRAMRHAVKSGLISADPTMGVETPAHESKEMKPFTQAEAAKLIEKTADGRWHALIVLALTTGMRQGELFGLEWPDVDLKNGKLTIRQAAAEVGGAVTIRKPKTKSSCRTIELVPAAVDALNKHRAILMREGHAGCPRVFPAPEGGLVSRSTFRNRYWNPLLDRCSLDRRGFHNTRHTYATLSIGAGVPLPVVSSVLGHSKPSTTLDIYSHVLPTHQKAATEVIQRLLG